MVQRCIDVIRGTARHELLTRIADNALTLMQDAFGNYVVQYMLDKRNAIEDNSPFVSQVIQQVRGNIAMLSQQKYSSNVVEVRLRWFSWMKSCGE